MNIQLLISIVAGGVALAVIAPIIARLIPMLRYRPQPTRKRRTHQKDLADRLAQERLAQSYHLDGMRRNSADQGKGFPHELYDEK